MDEKKIITKRALSISEAARYLCVSRGTIENWLAKGLLPCEEFPGRGKGTYRFRRIRLEDLVFFHDSYYKVSYQTDKVEEGKPLILLPRNGKPANRHLTK